VASVNEDCALKIAYAIRDPDTADWLSRMSGHILVDDEIRQVRTNVGLAETRENGRTLRQAERPLIDTNMLQSMPDRCAVLFGVGTARFFFTSAILVEKSPEATRLHKPPHRRPAGIASRSMSAGAATVAETTIDVD
jgi:type IV secretory pathway TraG/TraD family ATPase VirD4